MSTPTLASSLREPTAAPSQTPTPHPLTIAALRERAYVGSEIVVEQTLAPGANYRRYVVSYKSDGNKIFALMTIPSDAKPANGFPVIVMNHGYIDPNVYRTTERYVAYQDALARRGYITFKPDYRGHGDSEGEPNGDYETAAYSIDVLNAIEALKKHPDVDAARIGLWGHSMGGQVTLRSLVILPDVKAAVIWAGVTAPYEQLFREWKSPRTGGMHEALSDWGPAFVEQYGNAETNPEFWRAISATSFIQDITAPVQLHHSPNDVEVPIAFSEFFARELERNGKTFEFYAYPGDDHNLSQNFNAAMQRTISFFDKFLKP